MMCSNDVFRIYAPGKLFCMVLLSLLTVFVSGCIAVRQTSEPVIMNSAVLEAFSSNASLSYSSPDRSLSGSGVLMYRKPEQIRAVILSPFGSVLQEVYVSGKLVTIIDSGNGVALSGSSADLPVKGDFSGWRYIHWLVEIDPPDPSRRTETIARFNRFGQSEQAVFENGLLIAKSTDAGGCVRYGNYRSVQGVAFPLEITYKSGAGETFTIRFEDPEINPPFAEGAFTPNLGKLRMYPLSSLK
jgi:outer membrane lipoprotein-sorting protein